MNKLNLDFYASSNVGEVRKNNEDNFLVANLIDKTFWNASKSPNKIENLTSDNTVLLAVADGLGGALAGEVASQLAVNTVIEQLIAIDSRKDFSQYPFYEKLRLAIELANKLIITTSNEDVQYTGMGSTFTAIAISQGFAYTAQVGDSRCYLIRDNKIIQVTEDQSLVMQLLNSGCITPEEVENHPLKNVILQALGGQNYLNVVVTKFSLQPKDMFLICSDGLTTMLKDQEILDLISNKNDLKTTTEALIDLANKEGGYDNITIVLAKINDAPFKEKEDFYMEILLRDETLPKELDLFEVNSIEPITQELNLRENTEEVENISITQMIDISQVMELNKKAMSMAVTYSSSEVKLEVKPENILETKPETKSETKNFSDSPQIGLELGWKRTLNKIWLGFLEKIFGVNEGKKHFLDFL